jgi:hypothetical protein
MVKKISKADAINTKLREDGKVTLLNQQEHIEAITAMNKQLEVARREYKIKERKSQITAANVILTM